jgi:hypothetical protein
VALEAGHELAATNHYAIRTHRNRFGASQNWKVHNGWPIAAQKINNRNSFLDDYVKKLSWSIKGDLLPLI